MMNVFLTTNWKSGNRWLQDNKKGTRSPIDVYSNILIIVRMFKQLKQIIPEQAPMAIITLALDDVSYMSGPTFKGDFKYLLSNLLNSLKMIVMYCSLDSLQRSAVRVRICPSEDFSFTVSLSGTARNRSR
jgi:hypothetical protein